MVFQGHQACQCLYHGGRSGKTRGSWTWQILLKQDDRRPLVGKFVPHQHLGHEEDNGELSLLQVGTPYYMSPERIHEHGCAILIENIGTIISMLQSEFFQIQLQVGHLEPWMSSL